MKTHVPASNYRFLCVDVGDSDAMAHYRASELVEATSSGEDHSYVAKLTIGSVTANDHANQIQLLVVPPGGNKKKPHV